MPNNMKRAGKKYNMGGGYGPPKPRPFQDGRELEEEIKVYPGAMKNGGPTNFELAQKAMGGKLKPFINASGKEVPGMYS